MRRKHALALAMLAAVTSAARVAAQTSIDDRWVALGASASITSGYSIRDADSDALLGETRSRSGIGFEIRGQFQPRFGLALSGEYVFDTGGGPLGESGGAEVEGDFFLNTRGPARVYLGAVAGSKYSSYDGIAGGQAFQGTRLALGPVAGVLLSLGGRARLGVNAEYLLGSSPYTASYKNGAAGNPPRIATPGTLVVRARLMFITMS